jgi:hypothetical protein
MKVGVRHPNMIVGVAWSGRACSGRVELDGSRALNIQNRIVDRWTLVAASAEDYDRAGRRLPRRISAISPT